jgi:hypothetical protein
MISERIRTPSRWKPRCVAAPAPCPLFPKGFAPWFLPGKNTHFGLWRQHAIITYLDRVCISVAGPRMQDALHISPEQWGWVTGIFTLADAEPRDSPQDTQDPNVKKDDRQR